MKKKKGIFGSIICSLTFNIFGIILLIAAIQSNEPVAFSGWFFIFLFFFFGIAALVDIISTLKK